ncbi:HIT family protein [Ramlibacter algicola]|uniref:HIT family protein n=1 Tax=Ramlibacter algicola TaxID=2795217 RepID=A0A934Q3Z3_9BURK|nr:HIT family protein [Ramlibacter algicola]MBK0394443.1 HIT family protein [Ramlibacter algicola]
MARVAGCVLCETDGGAVVASTPSLRVIRSEEDPRYPAFYRVVWTDHAPEFTDLSVAQRAHCLEVVALVEEALRRHLRPHKVNLASLGNAVPHLHWHVIARWPWDAHFPGPVWAVEQRQAPVDRLAEVTAALQAVEADIAAAMPRLAAHHRSA